MASKSKKTDPLASLDRSALPRHVAVIMDGNGRWAKSKGWRRVRGHEEGAESVRVIVRSCRKLGIDALTLYAFSEENWARPKAEVEALMRLLGRFLKKERQEMLDQGIRLNAIGSIERLPKSTRKLLDQTMADTSQGKDMVLTLALSYGGRQELTQAARRLAADAAAGKLDPESIGEDALAARLYTAGLPEVDLMIRTSGELRVSNFLLWQIAYAEFYFTDTFFPDFREAELARAFQAYADRERRFGQTGDQLGVSG
ncbi:MAG: isoprenyl transferase [Desulfarculaceae bacterium]|nr:isoprenyl transferase [Desulfarculaceae bacterium]MCF8071009.1 isoprenyl transferase [Desulfarculaceae bacterium]MCF8100597.1 isoprenyl transferase [Desulfarculaceae bacterium]MCF8117729.1 isoprenyl transferase [Desulfarculaceae bacterium]